MATPLILLVEDDEDEKFLAERVLIREGLDSILHIPDGLQARAFLEERSAATRSSDPTASQLPDVVLMDLKLPGMNGHQILEWMDKKPEFGGLLRYVLSSSGNPSDRSRAELAKIDGYFVKPLSLENIARIKKAYLDQRQAGGSGE